MDDRRTLAELQARREMCLKFIELLEGMTDPRKDAALVEYRRQLQSLNEQIDALKPPPVVVGLKTATLSGKVQGD